MKNLAHSASFHSKEKIAPSKSGIKHPIRDGVYASLTRDTRRDLHSKAAAFYADHDAVLKAEHLDKAEDPAAARTYLYAAEAETAAFRQESAVTMALRGLDLARQYDDIAKLGLAVGRLRLTSGETRPAREAFERMVYATSDDTDRCRGLIGLAAADRVLTDLDQAATNLDKAESIACSAAIKVRGATIWMRKCRWWWNAGRA